MRYFVMITPVEVSGANGNSICGTRFPLAEIKCLLSEVIVEVDSVRDPPFQFLRRHSRSLGESNLLSDS